MSTHYGDHQLSIYQAGLRGERPHLPLRADDLERAAEAILPPESYWYVAGGAGEATMRANRAAFDRYPIVPRMLTDVSRRELGVELFGRRYPTPVLLAPIGVQSIIREEAELAVAQAAAACGVAMILSTVSAYSLEAIAEAMGNAPRWFQLYWPKSDALAASFIQRAESAGYEAIVITLDTKILGWRERDLAGAFLPFLLGQGLANYTSDPVFRDGLEAAPEEDMAPEQAARLAIDHGIDGIIVSNHGGRQVNGAIAALEALPRVREAVGGRIPVLFDSGIRSGSDILKAKALGADAVLFGRPYIWGLALGGQQGVAEVVRRLLADLDLSMALAGRARFEEIGRELLG